jgi:hypothetical protein
VYSQQELAWAAGLFDGEGYIGCIPRLTPRGRPNPRMDTKVIQWRCWACLSYGVECW